MNKVSLQTLAAAAFLAVLQMMAPGAAEARRGPAGPALLHGIQVGMPYKMARARLFAAGYMGVLPKPAAGRCNYREEICRAYSETSDCAPTGLAPCRFEFKKRLGRKIVIISSGEDLADLIVKDIFRE